MATCPRCREFLGDDHQCDRAVLRRRRVRRTMVVTATGVVGSLMGLMFSVQAPVALSILCCLLAALVADAVWQSLTR